MPQHSQTFRQPRCQISLCENLAERAWQPFGPNESIESFTLLGCHYRGFPVIKVCFDHRIAFGNGADLGFTHKGQPYLASHALNRCVASPF